jgi:2-methylisocitrate lyase-like PEP mutase family enzyme
MTMSQLDKARRFRALHDGPTFVIPNPWDLGSARILEALGFPALATTSAGFAFTLGRRDGAVSRDQVLEHCRTLAAATDLPVAADLENCFGDLPETVAETIRLAAATGLVGGSVEDFSGDDGKPIYDFGLAVERVAAAVEAAQALPFPFTLAARSENFLHGRPDLDDTIRRLAAFSRAGADVLYAPGLPNLAAVKAVCEAVHPKPVNVLIARGGADGAFTVASLAAAGVRRISTGGALARAALGGLLAAARELQDGSFAFLGMLPSMREVNGYMAGR